MEYDEAVRRALAARFSSLDVAEQYQTRCRPWVRIRLRQSDVSVKAEEDELLEKAKEQARQGGEDLPEDHDLPDDELDTTLPPIPEP